MALVTNAVVFVLSQHLLPDAERCIAHCLAQGYHMIGLIKDDWEAAMKMLHEGKASVIVAADPQHVDPLREPRVEFVALHRPRNAGPAASRPGKGERTQLIRRNAAG